MLTINSPLFALLFSLGIVASYLTVRLAYVRVYQVFIVGSIVNSLFFFMFAITRDNSFGQALTVGLSLGFLFTALSVTLGSFFRQTETTHAMRVVKIAAETLKS
jgi:hypothetical protein